MAPDVVRGAPKKKVRPLLVASERSVISIALLQALQAMVRSVTKVTGSRRVVN